MSVTIALEASEEGGIVVVGESEGGRVGGWKAEATSRVRVVLFLLNGSEKRAQKGIRKKKKFSSLLLLLLSSSSSSREW